MLLYACYCSEAVFVADVDSVQPVVEPNGLSHVFVLLDVVHVERNQV